MSAAAVPDPDVELAAVMAGDDAPFDPEDLVEAYDAFDAQAAADEAVRRLAGSGVDVPRAPTVFTDEHKARIAWRPETDAAADWALAILRSARARIDEAEARYAAQVERLGEWRDRVTRADRRTAAHFDNMLVAYAIGKRDADDRRRTIVLVNGELATTRHRPRAVVDDEPDVIRWAGERLADDLRLNDLIHTEKTVRYKPFVKLTRVVEIPTTVVLTCGCVIELPIGGWPAVPGRGDAVVCPSCGQDALVGDWTATRLAVVENLEDGDDVAYRFVPGADVEPERITAVVKPKPIER